MVLLKAIKSQTPLIAGSTALTDKDAEMWLNPNDGLIFIRRRGKLPPNVPTQFIVHISRVDRVEVDPALEQLDDIFEGDPEPVATLVTTMPVYTANVQMPEEPKPPPAPVKDDEERAIKINGTVEFRRGPMKPDEIEARVQAKKDRVEALLQVDEAEWTPEQRKLVEEYTASNPPDAVPTPPAAPSKPRSIADLIKRE